MRPSIKMKNMQSYTTASQETAHRELLGKGNILLLKLENGFINTSCFIIYMLHFWYLILHS